MSGLHIKFISFFDSFFFFLPSYCVALVHTLSLFSLSLSFLPKDECVFIAPLSGTVGKRLPALPPRHWPVLTRPLHPSRPHTHTLPHSHSLFLHSFSSSAIVSVLPFLSLLLSFPPSLPSSLLPSLSPSLAPSIHMMPVL